MQDQAGGQPAYPAYDYIHRTVCRLKRVAEEPEDLDLESNDAIQGDFDDSASDILCFNPRPFSLRSRTTSCASSVFSSSLADCESSFGDSAVPSPISTSYASDTGDSFRSWRLEKLGPRYRRPLHHHQQSTGSCTTWADDSEDDSRSTSTPFDPKQDLDMEDCDTESACGQATGLSSPATERVGRMDETFSPKLGDGVWLPSSPSQAASRICDVSSTASDETSREDADSILTYTLHLLYGIDYAEVDTVRHALRNLTQNFVRDVSNQIWQTQPSDGDGSQASGYTSMSTSPQGHSNSIAAQNGAFKRRKTSEEDDNGDDGNDGNDERDTPFSPPKKQRQSPKDEENLRLSCPFRKRNPYRFNVRDYHSCAMTYFPKFAELRQHIVKQHKRDDPSAFVCDRCTRNFISQKDLRDHRRLPKELMCDISDHDPESGIDGATSNKLLSRKRASGTNPLVQWREIWALLFPDDGDMQVPAFQYTPVVEHFELTPQFLASFANLKASLGTSTLEATAMEALYAKFQECFLESIARCAEVAQNMPYINRSNKKNELARLYDSQFHHAIQQHQRKEDGSQSRADSGVALDGSSEESRSTGAVEAEAAERRESIGTSQHDWLLDTSKVPTDVATTGRTVSSQQSLFMDPALSPSRQLSATPGADVSNTSSDAFRLDLICDWNNSVLEFSDVINFPEAGTQEGQEEDWENKAV